MKRGHENGPDDSARRQRQRYEAQPQINGLDKHRRPTLSPFPASNGGGGGGGARHQRRSDDVRRQADALDKQRQPTLAPLPASTGGGADAAQAQVPLLSEQKETDAHRLAQRQKQIDYGKNTLGYDRYCAQVPRHRRGPRDPVTPDKTAHVGKKAFDRMVSKWRQALHKYDPPELAQQQAPTGSSASSAAQPEEGATGAATALIEPQVAAALPSVATIRDAGHVETKPVPPAVAEPASHSIFDNFDEAEGEVDSYDDDDDDLL